MKKLVGDSPVRLCIPSFDGVHGEVYIYKTNHHPDYKMDFKEKMLDVALATSAAPTFFRPHKNTGYRLVDGGVWANNPIMIGVVDALACNKIPREKIIVLSIGCGSTAFSVSWIRALFSGIFFWTDVMVAAMNLQSENAIGQAGLLIGRDNIIRLEPDIGKKIVKLDNFKLAKILLPAAAKSSLEENGEMIKERFFQEKAAPYTKYFPEGNA